MNFQTEALLARVMIELSKEFKNHLVLKGGMLLRLLNSPRSTQDIDFVLLSEESKKKLIIKIRESLLHIKGLQIMREELNSRGLFIEIQDDSKSLVLIEISVKKSMHLDPEAISSFSLTSRHALPTVLITAMALPEAFSHKIAASIERQTMRDLYDLSLYESMGTFDVATLKDRLAKVSVNRSKPRHMSVVEVAQQLRKRVESLTENDLKRELYPLLPKDMQQAQLRLIQTAVQRLAQQIETQGF